MVFSFFKKVRNKAQDAKTVASLCRLAEQIANNHGEEKPAMEHFVLASLKMEDDSARQILAHFNVDESRLSEGFQQQHQQALADAGIVLEIDRDKDERHTPKAISATFYNATPCGQALMQQLYEQNHQRSAVLISAHVLEAAMTFERGVWPLTLEILNINRAHLQDRIRTQLES